MKVALTGSSGMLGHAVQRVFINHELVGFTSKTLDITLLDRVRETIHSVRPEVLIHAAAFTNVDQCEAEPEKAYLVNGIGSRNLAIACEEVGCPIVYISSDYVFNGTKATPYDEWDDTDPMSRYGLSKLMGERFISSFTRRYYIVRTSWLFGLNGKNFVDTIIKLLSERDRIEVVNDQRGCPTLTDDLALKLHELLGKGYGTYHVTNSGSCTWYDFAVEIAAQTGSRKEITPVTSGQFKRPAKRPANSVLGNTMLRLEGLTPARNWKEALKDYLKV